MALLLTGCVGTNYRSQPNTSVIAKTKPSIVAVPFCDVIAAVLPSGIQWSAQDTDETKRQADRLNAIVKRCPQYKKVAKAKPKPAPDTTPIVPTLVPTYTIPPAPTETPPPDPAPPMDLTPQKPAPSATDAWPQTPVKKFITVPKPSAPPVQQ